MQIDNVEKMSVPKQNRSRCKPPWKLIVLGILIIAVLILIAVFRADQYLAPDTVRSMLRSNRQWGPILLILLNVVRPLTFIPASTLSIPAGAVFGVVVGGIYTIIGVTCGAVFAFWLARFFGREYVERLLAKRSNGRLKIVDMMERKDGFKIILLCQLFPVIPFDVINYATGLSKMKFTDFLMATMIGVIPASFIFSYIGSSLTDIKSKQFIYSMVMLGLMALIPLVYHWWSKKMKTNNMKE